MSFRRSPRPWLDESARNVEGLLLSPPRAGAMIDPLYEIGRQTVADAGLILRGLPAAVLLTRPAIERD
jgi:hypothetical protein